MSLPKPIEVSVAKEIIQNDLIPSFYKIFNNEHSTLSFEKLYKQSYTLVIDRHGQLLYDSVHLFFKNYCEENILGNLNNSDNVIDDLCDALNGYLNSVFTIADVLMYLDNTFIIRNNLLDISFVGIEAFVKYVIRSDDDNSDNTIDQKNNDNENASNNTSGASNTTTNNITTNDATNNNTNALSNSNNAQNINYRFYEEKLFNLFKLNFLKILENTSPDISAIKILESNFKKLNEIFLKISNLRFHRQTPVDLSFNPPSGAVQYESSSLISNLAQTVENSYFVDFHERIVYWFKTDILTNNSIFDISIISQLLDYIDECIFRGVSVDETGLNKLSLKPPILKSSNIPPPIYIKAMTTSPQVALEKQKISNFFKDLKMVIWEEFLCKIEKNVYDELFNINVDFNVGIHQIYNCYYTFVERLFKHLPTDSLSSLFYTNFSKYLTSYMQNKVFIGKDNVIDNIFIIIITICQLFPMDDTKLKVSFKSSLESIFTENKIHDYLLNYISTSRNGILIINYGEDETMSTMSNPSHFSLSHRLSTIFHYVIEKDIFEVKYRTALSKRLLTFYLNKLPLQVLNVLLVTHREKVNHTERTNNSNNSGSSSTSYKAIVTNEDKTTSQSLNLSEKRIFLKESELFSEELKFIDYIRVECGNGFLSKIDVMFEDLLTSLKINNSFQESNQSSINFSCCILTNLIWSGINLSLESEFALNYDTLRELPNFAKYYKDKFVGRKLLTSLLMGSVVLSYEIPRKEDNDTSQNNENSTSQNSVRTVDITMSPLCAVILIKCFNNNLYQNLSISDIIFKIFSTSKILESNEHLTEFNRHLYSLSENKNIPILIRSNESKFMRNNQFNIDKNRVKLPLIKSSVQQVDNVIINEPINSIESEERNYSLDALIIRYLKGTMGHVIHKNQIYTNICDLKSKMSISPEEVYRRMESLVSREFVEIVYNEGVEVGYRYVS